MRAIEQTAIESGMVSGQSLMERAGQGVVDAVLDVFPALVSKHAQRRALVLCGPGNNGGDGYVIARLLVAQGWTVALFALGDPAQLPPDAKANAMRWQASGGAVGALDEIAAKGSGGAADLVVDALFGTGLARPLDGVAADALGNLRDALAQAARRIPVVAVDIPSGVCGDSGRVLNAPLPADLTVSFHRAKRGHYLDQGPAMCGQLRVADIGLGPWAAGRDTPPTQLAVPDTQRLMKQVGHKYTHGHALVLTGAAGRTGAARLAARAALRIGAGLVTLGAPGDAYLETAAAITAIMLRRVDDGTELTRLLEDPRFNALCLGPGLGTGARARTLIGSALASGRAMVLDADALTVLAEESAVTKSDLHAKCVLTPHDGEFARLFPDLHAKLSDPPLKGPAFGRIDAAEAAAARAGCTVLLKGADTVIATPGATTVVNAASYERAAPWLATAGSGDVLSGLIAGLLARGAPPHTAAQTAAWLHVEAARRFGPGLIAEDLPETMPLVLRDLAGSGQ